MDFNIQINNLEAKNKKSYGTDQVENVSNEKSEKFNIAKKLEEEKTEITPAKQTLLNCFSLEYYQPYFDLESSDIAKRLIYSFKPLKPDFISIVQKQPDLYGPIWIYATLIFLVAVTGNLSNYLKSDSGYQPNFNIVPTATCLLMAFGFGIPLILSFIMKWFGSDVTYIQVLCIYGYSLTCFIPVSFLCCIPLDILQWIFLLYGIVNSTAFLIVNFWAELGKYIDKRRYIVLGFVAFAQIIVFLTYKLYFFAKIYGQ